ADGRMPVTMTADDSSVYYLTYDQVGSLRIVTDASGTVVRKVDCDSFGNIYFDSNPASEVPFGFAGGLHDRNTGLVRFGYRDYDPDAGRWTAKDPILFKAGDADIYGYCLNDPVNWIDPWGLVRNDGIKRFPCQKPLLGEHGGGSRGFPNIRGWFNSRNNTPSSALKNSPYHPGTVRARVKPPYRANPAHDPACSRFNPKKTPEPGDAVQVYKNSVRSGMGEWYGIGKDGQIYRYFSDNAGGVHFSGIVQKSSVPTDVRKQLGLSHKGN
ncbi:MAG: RHS repeat-associated core domain-containing protein, partial [Desulfobacterales bacterium]|nr:RHS repeat-associated core domain-containing protein [Desulfobacterales bacterium]